MLAALDELDANPGAGAAPRIVLPRAIEIGEALIAGLRTLAGDGAHIELAGSIRRQADSVKDIDIVATTTRPTTLAKSLAKLEQIERVSSAGKAGAKARTHAGVGVDLRIAAPAQLGNLLQHFTGSGAHNAALREAAVRRGLHVSEYGILDDATGATDTCATEHEVYERLGLAYIEPELREDRGELEAARDGTLPQLIELADIRGDLHSHTIASDGHDTIEEMALAARSAGLRVPRDHRPLGQPRLRQRRLARAAAPPDRAGARRPTSRSKESSCWRAARSTSCPTDRSTTRTSCSASSTG